MGVRSSQDIVDHLDKVMAAQPPEVQAAVDHAHGILGLQSPVQQSAVGAESPMAASAPTPAAQDQQPIAAPPAGMSPIVDAGSPSDVQPLPTPKLAIASPVTSDPASGLPITPSAPQSSAAPAPLQNPHMANLERMTTEGTGTNKIHNPFLRGLATVGDAIGSGLFPEFARFVPGTSAHHQQLIGEEEGQLGQEREQQKAVDESATASASQKHLNAESDELQHRGSREDAQATMLANNPNWEESKELTVDPDHPDKGPQVTWISKKDPTQKLYVGTAAAKPVDAKNPTNDLEAWLQAPEHKGKPIDELLTAFWSKKADASGQEKSKPLSDETAKTLNAAWNSIAPKYHLAADPFRSGMSDSETKHVQDSMNAIVQRNQGAQNITINEGKAETAKAAKQDALTSKAANDVHKRLTTGFDKLVAQSDALDQAISEIGGNAPGQAVGTIKSIVGLAGGQGTGVRITQAELDSLVKARGLADTFGGWVSSLSGGGKMDANQVKQIKSLLQDAKARADEKRQTYFDSIKELGSAPTPTAVRDIENRFNESMIKHPDGAAPSRPNGVPDDAKWNASKRVWEK